MQLSEAQKETLRTRTVEFLLDLRWQVIRAGSFSPLTLWDTITSRMRAAANVCASPEEWTSKMLRDLKVTAPSVRGSSASLTDLCATVRDLGPGAASAWLDLVVREHGLLVALAQQLHEQCKDQRAAAALAASPTDPTTTTDPTTATTEETAHV